ncbi:TauD/TfdA family dioxygenase [Sphingopyxis alaskensis]|uniref:TauD/TfdA family dioxygenase n=1 Tax=Sphingopyxis alaskensis TaxID=117207 RepID=UPI00203B405D|nr:TauD/TfdA family dioxygenase [Sphingopyxis alaskensis]MCM3420865.1 TauD/TfdA family dioxygenase [Sphingopyxis alaskensis]
MAASDIVSDPEQVLGPLFESGWSLHSSEAETPDKILQEMVKLGDRLGTRVAGRAGQLGEVVQPIVADEAHPRSLSARYGLGALPFHTELSHRPRPCRYLLLGCVDPGSPAAATILLDWRRLGFAREELALLEEVPVLVHTGRRSFYSTILAPGGAFLRYDPGCLEPLDERGRKAMQLVENRATRAPSYAHHWRRGDVLIIDNWRVLHGRSPSDHGSGRRLARILIDA